MPIAFALSDIIRVLVPAAATFAVGIALAPILTHYLYKYRAWKKRPGKVAYDGQAAHEFNRLHTHNEVRAPRMGGIVVWASVLVSIAGIAALSRMFPGVDALQLDYLSRSQTWIPLAALLVGAFAGLVDDLLVIGQSGEGLPLRFRLFIVFLLSAFIGWWFFDKLDVVAVGIPFGMPYEIGMLIIPFFIIVSLALYASGVIDGIDGLSGGVFASIFASYTIIAFVQQQIDLAAFSASVVGGLLAFLWFNIPPARFYMSDTGTMGLTLAIGTIAFMTDELGGGIGIFVLPIIGFLLAVTVASDVLQLLWKRIFGRKLLRIAPLHHHFEAIGWPGPKVVMRYWVLSVVFAFIGVILAISSLAA
jgi:phospho-N-acetylmuramoyl-pentapeptide-transferase